ncbi:hypothetical protein [Pseudomonas syringae]|uniref:hypothetical protein n=1 Tax=Pseudomonas syringae TaxID=317 RepID=UPI001F2CD959|nr:hypothetical protein [Pseudomonas syringae]MCF5721493.1 hypothetical protein [Pseudomonas syringae]
MNYYDELARLTESVSVLERQLEYMRRDRDLQRDLAFEKKCNALLDEYGCPIELLLEVVCGRPDISDATRAKLTAAGGLIEPPPVVSPVAVKPRKEEVDQRPANANAAAWQEKFGHRSLGKWFQHADS